ncbi:MAG: hypothetical protein K6A68_00900, partial [Clostridiales bacterium]|nr:hypothetical protein [Clostridiales bacterium]
VSPSSTMQDTGQSIFFHDGMPAAIIFCQKTGGYVKIGIGSRYGPAIVFFYFPVLGFFQIIQTLYHFCRGAG